MNKRRAFLWLTPPLAACAVVAWAATSHAVYYNGQTLTQDARQMNGQTYVPLADVARALGGRVATHPGGGLMIATDNGAGGSEAGRPAAGGANEVRGTRGAVGDWFFNGFWRFRVNSVEHPDTYNFQYAAFPREVKPHSDTDQLVVLHCTVKNGQKKAAEPILTTYGTAVQQTALTDDQGQSYAPLEFDVRSGDLASGAAKNFVVVFSVPKDAHLKDLIFTLYSTAYGNKPSNVRVSLAGQ